MNRRATNWRVAHRWNSATLVPGIPRSIALVFAVSICFLQIAPPRTRCQQPSVTRRPPGATATKALGSLTVRDLISKLQQEASPGAGTDSMAWFDQFVAV